MKIEDKIKKQKAIVCGLANYELNLLNTGRIKQIEEALKLLYVIRKKAKVLYELVAIRNEEFRDKIIKKEKEG